MKTGLTLGMLGLLSVACLAPTSHCAPEAMVDDGPANPKEAIAELLAGNERYQNGRNKSENPVEARKNLAAGQAPFAAIIRCADSRVAPEIVFDQPLGDLFVCGVAGNIPTMEIIASLEFGVAVLGAKVIVIMGHSSCGAVDAAITHQTDTSALPGSLPELIDQIVVPCAVGLEAGNPADLEKAIACNANSGIAQLIRRSEVLSDAVKAGTLEIVAGVQNLKSGRFTITKMRGTPALDAAD